MEHDEQARELASHAIQVLTGQWVRAAIAVLPSLAPGSRGRTDFARTALRDFARLRDTHHPHVTFMHFLRALANEIRKRPCHLHAPLCDLFDFVKRQYPDPAAYGAFDFTDYVNSPRFG